VEPAVDRTLNVSVACSDANRVAAKWPGWSFAVTILLSAFLLFQVQPLVSKAILPWFGGCPAVWTTCMLFFQVLLFGGYAYADLSRRFLAPRSQVLLHLALVAVAILLMPIAPGPDWKPDDSDAPAARILLLLTCTVGLPYFALSATSPLVQAWFNRTYPGRSPYRLYALSNVGSLAALLSYPFFFEWALDLPWQSWLWSGAFAVYAGLCGACWLWLRRAREAQVATAGAACPAGDCDDPPAAPPAWFHRVLWVLLPACASLMLLATTNHVCQDVAVVPFLWVVPLSLYLLSFIVCFDHQRWYSREIWATLAALAIVAAAACEATGYFGSSDFLEQLALYFSLLFFVCMTFHGELVQLKPDPRHLTEFYLLIAAGGALGGAAVSLAAPAIFDTFLEWEIGLLLCFAASVVALGLPAAGTKGRPLPVLAVLLAASLAFLQAVKQKFHDDEVLERARSFYGVVSVAERHRNDPAKHAFVLLHGRIQHGVQFADPTKRRIATSYYGEQSGVGRTLKYFNASSDGRPLRVGTVGLGVGTLAAYARPGDRYRFYEINPDVWRLARDYFTYLSDCRGKCEVVMGDARLSLERELREDGPQGFDVLVLDAFSGDSIPTHLLTDEVFAKYDAHLAADGVIAVHITNHYLDLAPVVRGLAKDYDLQTLHVSTEGVSETMTEESNWMLLTRNQRFLKEVKAAPPEDEDETRVVPKWTDQYNNLFQILY
jgi:spermidine synthase